MTLRQQQGVVLVLALFIVALVATMSYVMLARLSRDIERTQLLLRSTQAEFYAEGSIAWAKSILHDNGEAHQVAALVDATPIVSPVNVEDGFRISSTIYDMQAKFNLNNLRNANAQHAFKQLLQAAMPALNEEQASEMVSAISEWIAPGIEQTDLSKYYLQLATPYSPAHRYMISASELALIKGMTPQIYQALMPYVVVLPGMTAINVQTARAPVLMMLSPALSPAQANNIEQIRGHSPFILKQDFLKIDFIKHQSILEDAITVVSRYFLVETHVDIENQKMVIYTLMERLDSQSRVNILWQSKGSY